MHGNDTNKQIFFYEHEFYVFSNFSSFAYVKKKLIESGDKELIEDSWRDSYWGWGPNKDGENHLGKLWMEVRDEFKATDGP